MTKSHQNEPFFITEEVEAKLTAAGYEFEPTSHTRATSLPKILAGLTDAALATWPGVLPKEEIERRQGRALEARQGAPLSKSDR